MRVYSSALAGAICVFLFVMPASDARLNVVLPCLLFFPQSFQKTPRNSPPLIAYTQGLIAELAKARSVLQNHQRINSIFKQSSAISICTEDKIMVGDQNIMKRTMIMAMVMAAFRSFLRFVIAFLSVSFSTLVTRIFRACDRATLKMWK